MRAKASPFASVVGTSIVVSSTITRSRSRSASSSPAQHMGRVPSGMPVVTNSVTGTPCRRNSGTTVSNVSR
jgi:hypothetical protein